MALDWSLYIQSFGGGALIGASSALFLLLDGRIGGISQICTLHTFRRRKMRQTLQFGGLSVWHLDCGTALCQLTEAHRQQRVRVPRLSVTPNHLRKFRYCQVLTPPADRV